jgi:uncharacterized small protein (DUF1192 family)
MAKALFGHLATADARHLAELATLRRRITDLEAEVAELRAGLAERDAAQALHAVDLDVELRALDDAHAASSH